MPTSGFDDNDSLLGFYIDLKKAKNLDLDKLPKGTKLKLQTLSGTIYAFELQNPRFGLGNVKGGYIAPKIEAGIIWGSILDEDSGSIVRRRYITQGYRLAFSTDSGTYTTSSVVHLWVDDSQLF